MSVRFAARLARSLGLVTVLLAVCRGSALAQAEIDCDSPDDREVRSLRFEGNRTLSDDELSARVLTTPSTFTSRYFGWFFGAGVERCLPNVGLAPDVTALKRFYVQNGFYLAKIDTVVTPQGENRVAVTFNIEEGAPAIVESLEVTGLDSVVNAAQVTRDLQLRPGERFGALRLLTDIDSITARLRNAGYPHALVLQNFDAGPTKQRVPVTLQVLPGPRARFGAIAISRTPANPENEPDIDSATVLRLLGFQSGSWFSDRALIDARRNLYNLGVYRHVGVEADTTIVPTDSLVRVNVDVREDFIRELTVEEGWATLDCFRLDGLYTDKNFADNAWRLDLTGRVSKLGYGAPTSSRATRNLCRRDLLDQDSVGSSKINYYAGASFRQPTLFGGHWVPAYSLYTERRSEYRAYRRTTLLGGDASATRTIGDRMPLRLGYSLEYGQTNAEPAFLCALFSACDAETRGDIQRRRPFAVASASFQRFRTDNVVAPRTGYSLSVEARGSAPFLGSDNDLNFYKLTGDLAGYRAVTSRITFAARWRMGFVTGGRTGAAKLPPPQERLYAGGATSVRGFQQNELGAVVYLLDERIDTVIVEPGKTVALVAEDSAGARRTIPVGGNSLTVLNVELRIRDPFFPDLIEYIPFVDAGELFTEGGTGVNNLRRLFVTPGLGIRYFSPVGPIQANVGYNPSKTRAGQAYFAPPVRSNNTAPLYCVTARGAPVVPISVVGNELDTQTSECPESFVPFRRNDFFGRFTFTLSIGTSF